MSGRSFKLVILVREVAQASCVTGVRRGGSWPRSTYLLELYGDAQTSSLHHARAEIRLLVLEAVHGAGRRSG